MFSFLLPKDKDDKKCNLTNMYVTEHHEMYFATFSNNRYNIYRVTESLRVLVHPSFIEDTCKERTYQSQLLLSYETSLIPGGDSLYNLWVKSSSNSKAPLAAISAGLNIQVSGNKKGKGGGVNIRAKSDSRLMMLHRNNLFSCIEGQEKPVAIAYMRNAKYVDTNNIYYETASDSPGDRLLRPSICVKRLQIVYSTLKKDVIYEVTNPSFSIVQNFSFDYSLQRVYVLIKDWTLGKPKFYIVIVDAINIEVLRKIDITDIPDLLGSFKGAKHFMANGNFYCRNTVYRLDPFNNPEVLF